MKRLTKKLSPIIFSTVFLVLLVTLLISQQKFTEFRLKKNLIAYQQQEMKITVENYINTIGIVRENVKFYLDQAGNPYTEDDVKKVVAEFVRKTVHNMNCSTGAYIWINEVVDYRGGENYAFRLVHGNLPETEGTWLSTKTEDAHGNRPYLVELEGINKNGEVSYEYYFKEYKRDEVSKKITYAKLYRDYNWIVCTGTYYSSFFNPAGGLTSADRTAFTIFYSVIFVLAAALMIYTIFKTVMNSKKLQKETEKLKHAVSKDSLTGAGSRSFGTNLLHDYLKDFKKNGNNHSIAMLDIDNFKDINDRYGHNVGDDVIKSLVSKIKENQEQGDHVIRWGGDEFILTYRDLNGQIDSVLDDLTRKVNDIKIRTENGTEFNFSVSIGASNFSESDNDVKDAIKRIDDALYLAKRDRNTFYIL